MAHTRLSHLTLALTLVTLARRLVWQGRGLSVAGGAKIALSQLRGHPCYSSDIPAQPRIE